MQLLDFCIVFAHILAVNNLVEGMLLLLSRVVYQGDWHDYSILPYPTLSYLTLSYPTLPCPTLPYQTYTNPILPYPTLI